MATPLASAAPPRRARNLAEFVVSYVTEQIASNALKPGDKLPTESQLMVTLSVSRTVIREAISRLQAGKIIETRLSALQFPAAAANAVILLGITILIISALTRIVDIRKEL